VGKGVTVGGRGEEAEGGGQNTMVTQKKKKNCNNTQVSTKKEAPRFPNKIYLHVKFNPRLCKRKKKSSMKISKRLFGHGERGKHRQEKGGHFEG